MGPFVLFWGNIIVRGLVISTVFNFWHWKSKEFVLKSPQISDKLSENHHSE